jgi:hypothetical protein
MLSGPRHEASEASDAIPRGAESKNWGSQVIVQRCPSCRPPRPRRRGCADGAMVLSQDEIDGSAPASSALRRRLEC